MTAQLSIIKYTGKDSDFGNLVSSIGIKRIDQAVPAVYGTPVVPGNDTSDAMMYCVYRPDDPSATAYSFESIFKLKLAVAPDHQLSNIRIYPVGERPRDPNAPKLMIGCNSTGYTRPTNNASAIAINDIWNYSKKNPYPITIGGTSGTSLDPSVDIPTYNISLADIGTGNVIYLNGIRQYSVQLVGPRAGFANTVYTFIDQTGGAIVFTIYDPATSLPITNSAIVNSVDGSGRAITTITATPALLSAYPNGFLYGSATSINVGSQMEWLNMNADPITTEIHDVEVVNDPYGKPHFWVDGVYSPIISLQLDRKYVFNNHSGDSQPMRFINNNWLYATETNIVIAGITVQNGATANEIITVDPRAIQNAGFTVTGYQSATNGVVGCGSSVNNMQYNYTGNYNMNLVGGGTNPTSAGETDYIYLQLQVKGTACVGNFIPQISVEYDEN